MENLFVAKDIVERLVKIKRRQIFGKKTNINRNLLIWGEKTYNPKKTYAEIGQDFGLSLERTRQIVNGTDRFVKKSLKELKVA